eukprot:CAMPEP_0204912310 /NCGR_PEP_ID=MMETSP1397-20131031/10485_1 /ASSEMBLY_ACC=CAM_ASM_000891 /TAXON_ID=49980 /ORGANISM="Climacostomum Climacostomum virens, Strain Stock W-24" /LENGTH=102 /DNA_ID=CAMNT_0052083211 /DNA_START=695 /DNA_END=1003 /DNA_ORIENTATION=-
MSTSAPISKLCSEPHTQSSNQPSSKPKVSQYFLTSIKKPVAPSIVNDFPTFKVIEEERDKRHPNKSTELPDKAFPEFPSKYTEVHAADSCDPPHNQKVERGG